MRKALPVVLLLFAVACGGGLDDGSDAASPSDGTVGSGDEPVGDSGATSGGSSGAGGGTLIFDGEEIPIERAQCVISGDSIDVGTISDSGWRVLVGTNGRNPISAQILDPDFVQWFPQGPGGVDEAEQDGNTFRSDTKPYFNNSDDRVLEASFTIECP